MWFSGLRSIIGAYDIRCPNFLNDPPHAPFKGTNPATTQRIGAQNTPYSSTFPRIAFTSPRTFFSFSRRLTDP